MLQQTQVERVIPFYKKFIKRFPTAKKLAAAPLSDVLKSWQGLGYNRRAKMLQAAAKEAVGKYKSIFPAVYSELVELPGIGPYTARAIAAFSYNENVIFVETNIRTAVIHHFFSRRSDVEDTEVLEVLKKALPKGKSREWYSALMDYGAHLKRSGISHNARSSRYIKQSKFVGSLREARGAILRELTKGFQTEKRLVGLLGDDRVSQMRTALTALVAEKFVVKKRSSFALAG
ncbi:MAG: HhH-GPD family protein [Parcubacteria group bacterium GW2011_GWA2_56_21]|nr:MAG: HhH-GPD family protein [Parcubacteria group bacterium GW2011_GWA2_56_21]